MLLKQFFHLLFAPYQHDDFLTSLEHPPSREGEAEKTVSPWISSASLQMKKEVVSSGTLIARVRGNDTALGAWSALWLMGTQWRDLMAGPEQDFKTAGTVLLYVCQVDEVV